MTIPSFTGLNTALEGLQASQAAIDTTGENIANANTPGYTRQVVNTAASDPIVIQGRNPQGGGTQLGTGVDITSISRIRDQFLDVQYRAQNTVASNANTMATQLQQVQTALNEPSSDGLQAQLSSFWSAWTSLAQSPTSAAAQQAVVDAGQTLASTFQSVSAQMTTVQTQAAQQYATLTGTNGQVEQDANQIATLNTQIAQATQAGQTPNTLLDQRDQLVDDLSGLAQVSVTPHSDGTVDVNFGDAATPLVKGSTVTWPQTLTSKAGGQLGALLNLSDTSSSGTIQQYLNSLNGVAKQVIDSVNGLQPPSSPFFGGTDASSITVTASPSSITTSSSSTSGPDLAQSIANLSGQGADQSYAAFVAQVGGSVQAAQNTQTTQQAILTAVSNQRQSVSGVSLDQEMTNLIQYQQAYQASARVMNAISTTFSDLMNVTL
ncbi:MAG TPA: flagellar hook-associated protein FlgK [Solirubrobacteraceae bacterium]|nr:flagellar hook-associated protein FlgK [Solirubrobacteraceae bacterium]